MLVVVVVAAVVFQSVYALPQPQSLPSHTLTARQTVVTNSNGITQTVQESSGPKTAVTIGATAGVIVGFIALILLGIWIGSWRRKKDEALKKSVAEAQQEARSLHRLTMAGKRPGSVYSTPTSSIGSSSKINRKSSALSLTPSTTSSFVSQGVTSNGTPPHEQRRSTVLHQPSPRTPSTLVQNSLLLHQQHSEYPPPPQPSNERPEARKSSALSTPSPEMNRTSYYSQQPTRPSPLSYSVTMMDSGPTRKSPSPPPFELPSRETSPITGQPPSFQPPMPMGRKSSGDLGLAITIPSPDHEGLRAPPGLENGARVIPGSIKSAELGQAL